MENKSIRYLPWGAIIAALYVLLTYLASLLGLASGVIQFRLSEALCIMACFTPAAIPGLYIGCLLSNILTGCVFWDILFGPIATLIGAVGTYLLRRNKYLAVIPPILANTLIVPFVLKYAYGVEDMIPYLMLTVGIGEVVTCGVLGVLLHILVSRYKKPMGLDCL